MPTTLRAARRRLGGAIGFFLTSTTTGASTATDSLTLGSIADAEAEASYLARCYAMPVSTGSTNAGIVRRIRKDGFTPATGVVRTVAAFTAVSTNTTVVEISAPLPPKDADGRVGLETLCNRVLAECWQIDSLAITPSTASQSTFSLATSAEWITRDDQIVDVWFQRSGSTERDLVPEWDFRYDMDAPILRIRGVSLSTADTLMPEVYRPLNTWIESGGTWAASTTGLSTETDRCLLPEEGFEVIGRAVALAELSKMGSQLDKQIDREEALQARQAADAWKHQHLPRKQGRPVHWTKSKGMGLTSYTLETPLG